MLILLIILLLLAGIGGGWGHSRYGYVGWSPALIILVVLIIYAASGRW